MPGVGVVCACVCEYSRSYYFKLCIVNWKLVFCSAERPLCGVPIPYTSICAISKASAMSLLLKLLIRANFKNRVRTAL